MLRIIFIFLVIMLQACNHFAREGKINNDIEKNKTDGRYQLISTLYNHINELIDAPFAEIIVKLDMLELEKVQTYTKNCPVSPLYSELYRGNDYGVSYMEKIRKMIKEVDQKQSMRHEVYLALIRKASQKISEFDKMMEQLDIMEEYGALSRIRILFAKNNQLGNKDAFDVLTNEGIDLRVLFKEKMEILAEINNLLERLPILPPMQNATPLSHYGIKINPISASLEQQWGMELRATENPNIYATGKGTVIHAGIFEDMSGYTVIVDHGNHIKTLYAGLSSPLEVKVNDKVDIMQVLGKQGSSEYSASNALHYEIRIDDKPIDPRIFLKTGVRCNYNSTLQPNKILMRTHPSHK